MSDKSEGEGWWLASDGKWYPPDSTPTEPTAPQPPTDGDGGSEPPAPWWKRTWVIVVGVALLAFVGGAVFAMVLSDDDSDGDSTATEADSSTTTSTEGSTTTTEAETTTTEAETTTTEAETTTTESTTTTSTTEPAIQNPEPVVFEGDGQDVIEFAIADPAVFSYSVTGPDFNSVWGLDEDFEQTSLLVSSIGPEEGQQWLNVFDDRPIAGFEVDAEGSWTLTVSPVTTQTPAQALDDFYVPVLDSTGRFATEFELQGTAPSAAVLLTESPTADITMTGESNNAIWAAEVSTGERSLLVNEIGNVEGTVRLPDCSEGCFVDISGGDYSISLPG